MIVASLTVSPADFAAATGWECKPEGLCKDDRCVPCPDGVRDDGALDVEVVARRLGMPIVEDAAHGLWAIGPQSGGHALESAEAPDLELPDVDGNPFRLSAMHGRKTLLVAWASW
jgi:hypothetical protein